MRLWWTIFAAVKLQGATVGGINSQCYGFTGGVTAHQDHVVPNPRIVLIYWNPNFAGSAAAIASMDQFVSDLANGKYWNGLGQYVVTVTHL